MCGARGAGARKRGLRSEPAGRSCAGRSCSARRVAAYPIARAEEGAVIPSGTAPKHLEIDNLKNGMVATQPLPSPRPPTHCCTKLRPAQPTL